MGGLSALAIQLANNDQADQPILGIHNINYSISATFFVNYIIFQTFLARTFMILQVPDYLSRYFKRKFAVTPREFEEANIFGLFPIWLAFDQSTIILGMVMSFTVIAPLIAPVGLVYFIVRFCADKTQLVAVKPKNTNTDCRTIPVLYLHFNLVVIWSEINVLIFFTIKQAPLLVLIMLFLIPATIFLMTLLLKNFKKSKRIAARDRAQLLESSFTEKELVNAYLHPALYPEPPDPLSPDIRFEDSRMFLQSPITSQIDREVLNPNDNIYDDVYEVRLNHN